ncbi:LUD domain-containing protein [bacterium]|nr:LUD domain-containing protein [bacterium]
MNARDRIFQRMLEHTASSGADENMQKLHNSLRESSIAASTGDAELFAQRAGEAGAEVVHAQTLEDVPEALENVLSGLASLVLSSDPSFDASGLAQLLSAHFRSLHTVDVADLKETQSGTGWKARLAAMDAGLDMAVAGIADSGAVLIRSHAVESRSMTLLPEMHIALLPAQRILPSLHHAAPLLRSMTHAQGHSAVTLVGGPSKTADIEKVLVTGIHGPARFVIVVIEADPRLSH